MQKILITTLCTTLLLSACSGNNEEPDATGVFETTEITVSARTAGELISLDVEEGRRLTTGQAVGLIDTVQLHLKKRELMARLRATDSRRYDVHRQLAALRQQIATEKREQRRYKELVARGAANAKQLDDIDARIALLEKQLAAQNETLEKGNRSVSGEIEAIEAQLAQTEDLMARSIVTCPTTGTVLAKYAECGELAQQGRPLFKVGDTEHLYLRAYMTAPQVAELKLGQRVSVTADRGDEGNRRYEGTITWISDKAEFTPKTIQTRDERANLVYAVKVAVKNDGFIKIGMYGDIKL